MSIYVDEIREYDSGEWCHCWTDETDESLDEFALQIGLKKQWAHASGGISGRFYHYDLRPSKRAQALKQGALFMPLATWISRRLAERNIQLVPFRSFDKTRVFTCDYGIELTVDFLSEGIAICTYHYDSQMHVLESFNYRHTSRLEQRQALKRAYEQAWQMFVSKQ